MYTDPTVKPWQSGSWVPKGHKSRYDAAEAAKKEQMAALGWEQRLKISENVSGNDVTRDSGDTQVEGEKEEERGPLPQFNRSNLLAREKEEDQIPMGNLISKSIIINSGFLDVLGNFSGFMMYKR